jgi:hypothetical protein
MTRLLLLVGLLTLATASYADPIGVQPATAVNDGMPAGYPAFLYIERVPFGSGTPAVGVTSGYEKATPVSGGLYHVPGYLPYGVEADTVEPRVVRLPCAKAVVDGQAAWACKGYAITPDLGRGENILIQPLFQQ